MIRRLTATFALAFIALAFVAAPAAAADVTADHALTELALARAGVAESVEHYREGRAEEAYLAARNAYLDHFEYVEIPLRVRDEALTLDLEERFAELRDDIQAGAPVGTVAADAAAVQEGLDEVERTLSTPGLAAPFIAAGYAFIILFREGIEAVLVVATLLGYLAASRNERFRRPVLQGVGVGVLAAIGAFLLVSVVFRIAPVQRELLEAVILIAAVAVLFYVSFWLVSRLDQRRWMEFMRARMSTAAATGSALALFGVGFTAVFREGLETALFYQALLSFAQGLEGWVLAGTIAAVAVLAVVAYLILKVGRRLPIRPMLTTAVILLMVMSVAFVGNAVRALQETGIVPVTNIDWLPRFSIFLAELTGWYPTLETVLAQVALATIYIAGGVWVFFIQPRRDRAASVGATSQKVPEPGSGAG